MRNIIIIMAPRHRDQRRPGRPGRCALLAATLGVGMAYPLVVLLANTRASAPEAAAAASAATAASMRRLEERRARAALPRAAPPAVLAAWPLADDELRDDGDGGVSPPTETKRCPDYSGPGFRFERFPMKERELIRIEVPFDAPPLGEAERPRSKLEGLPLSAVVLTPGTRLQRAQASDLEYLLALDHDALLWSWRTLAKLPTRGAQPLTGWEHPGSELRGHFLGHWLSAAAALIASLDHAALAAKARAVVAAIAECQAKLGTGYVSVRGRARAARLPRARARRARVRVAAARARGRGAQARSRPRRVRARIPAPPLPLAHTPPSLALRRAPLARRRSRTRCSTVLRSTSRYGRRCTRCTRCSPGCSTCTSSPAARRRSASCSSLANTRSGAPRLQSPRTALTTSRRV